MKLVLVTVLVISVIYVTNCADAPWVTWAKECRQNMSVPDANCKLDKDKICFYHCMAIKNKFMDEKGEVFPIDKINKKNMPNYADCNTKKDNDKCAKAKLIMECLWPGTDYCKLPA